MTHKILKSQYHTIKTLKLLATAGLLLVITFACQREEKEPLQDDKAISLEEAKTKLIRHTNKEDFAKERANVYRFVQKGLMNPTAKRATVNLVDLEKVLEYQMGKKASYSFVVNRENLPKNVVENLVVESVNDSLRAYLIRYYYPRPIDSIDTHERIDNIKIFRTKYCNDINELLKANDITPKNLTARSYHKRQTCYRVTLITTYSCKSGLHMQGDAGCRLKGSDRAYSTTYEYTTCVWEDYWWPEPVEAIREIAIDEGLGGGEGDNSSVPAIVNTEEKKTIKQHKMREDGILEDDQIIDNLTNPCAKSILNQMRSTTGVKNFLKEAELHYNRHNFSEMIIDLFEKSSQTHLIFQNNNNISNANGSTKGTVITLNSNYLKTATQLAIARTMIHEMVHAYLNATKGNKEGFRERNFQTLLINYFNNNSSKYVNDPNLLGRLHHEFMGQYVDAMAVSLQQWDIRYGTGTDLGLDYYKAQSYGGLFQTDANGTITTETDSFKQLVPNAKDRQDIANKILNEQNNTRNAKGSKCR